MAWGMATCSMLRDTASSRLLLLLLHACACACGVVAVARVARLDVRRAEFRAGAGARDRRHRDADRVDGSTPSAVCAANGIAVPFARARIGKFQNPKNIHKKIAGRHKACLLYSAYSWYTSNNTHSSSQTQSRVGAITGTRQPEVDAKLERSVIPLASTYTGSVES